MKKKWMLIVLLAAAVLCALAVYVFSVNGAESDVIAVIDPQNTQDAGQADETAAQMQDDEVFEIAELTGTITEITDEYVMLDAGEAGMIQANTTDDTLIEGVETLGAGQTALIIYDGKMTRSLPAQITALKIGVYAVSGTVVSHGEGSVTISQTEGGEIVLTLPQGAQAPAVGESVTAYTTGVSTMSIPPQMNAVSIVNAE